MNLNAYLDRVDYHPPQGRQILDLGHLHRQHLLHIPFENLSIHLGHPIRLSEEALFEKLVTRKRGGFCFEMNALFWKVLEAYDVKVTLLSCAVYNEEKENFGPVHSHLALMVFYKYDYWLVDVGFGDSFPEPLRLLPGQIQLMDGARYQFVISRDGLWTLMRSKGGDHPYIPMYRFSRVARQFDEFYEMCEYHQTSEKSHFTHRRLITQLIPDGRITLTDQKLKISSGSKVKEQAIESDEEFEKSLSEHFGMDWDEMKKAK